MNPDASAHEKRPYWNKLMKPLRMIISPYRIPKYSLGNLQNKAKQLKYSLGNLQNKAKQLKYSLGNLQNKAKQLMVTLLFLKPVTESMCTKVSPSNLDILILIPFCFQWIESESESLNLSNIIID